MFVIECPAHGQRVLVTATRIRHVRNTGDGILLTVECWCGTEVTVRTGRQHYPIGTWARSVSG